MDVQRESVVVGPIRAKLYVTHIFFVLIVLVGTVVLLARRTPPETDVLFWAITLGGIAAAVFLPIFLWFCLFTRERPAWGYWPMLVANVMIGLQIFVVAQEYF